MIRRATPNDIDKVNRLLHQGGFDRDATVSDLSDDNIYVFIDEYGLSLGVVYISRDIGRWTAHATSLVVDPEARGRGLAKQQVAAWEGCVEFFAYANSVDIRMFGYTNPSREATIHILKQRNWKQLSESVGDGSALWAYDVKGSSQ